MPSWSSSQKDGVDGCLPASDAKTTLREPRLDASRELSPIPPVLVISPYDTHTMALLVDKHRPRNLDALNYHPELSERLRALVSQTNPPCSV